MRESTLEKYFAASVRAHGGDSMKFVSPGRVGVPDRIVVWPMKIIAPYSIGCVVPAATIHFVELKAPGKKPKPSQVREHARLRALGCTVIVLDCKQSVDNYMRNR